MQTARVRLLTPRVGNTFNHLGGQVIEVDADEARRLVSSQQAEWIDGPPAEPVQEQAAAPVEVVPAAPVPVTPAVRFETAAPTPPRKRFG